MSQVPDPLALELAPGRSRRSRGRPRLGRRGAAWRRRGRRSRRRATWLLSEAARRQRSTVKISYAQRGRGARWGAHGAYLAREGAQRPGEKGKGFSTDRDDVDLAQTLKSWEAAGDARLFKMVVSPEQAARLDLRSHARALVAEMERDLGTRLEWVAIDHYNTDHPHLHVLVRGRDDQSRPLTLDPTYIKTGIRARSEALTTQALGWRTEAEIRASRGQAVERIQFTELDRALLRRAGPDHVIPARALEPEHPGQAEYRHQERGRLAFLYRLGLAEPLGRDHWRLSPSLESALRDAQRATDVVKTRGRHGAWLANPHLPVVVTQVHPGTQLSGRVVGTGLADELHDRRYLLLEGPDRLHYIAQSAAIQQARGGGSLRLGQRVALVGRSITREGRTMTVVDVHSNPSGAQSRMPTGARDRKAPGPTLESLRQTESRSVVRAAPVPGLIYRGRLVAYVTDGKGARLAVLDTGRELTAVPVARAGISPGRSVRATAREVEDESRTRRQLVWRLADDERAQVRHRART